MVLKYNYNIRNWIQVVDFVWLSFQQQSSSLCKMTGSLYKARTVVGAVGAK